MTSTSDGVSWPARGRLSQLPGSWLAPEPKIKWPPLPFLGPFPAIANSAAIVSGATLESPP